MIKSKEEFLSQKKPLLEDKEIWEIIEKWEKLLDIKEIPKRVFIKNTPRLENGSLAKVGLLKDNTGYGIRLSYSASKLELIHELGHIWLDKKTDTMNASELISKLKNPKIFRFINVFTDILVNYNLSKFPEFNQLIQKEIVKSLNYHIEGDIFNCFAYYLYYFINYKFLLSLLGIYVHNIRDNLMYCKSRILNEALLEKIVFPIESFDKLDEKLRRFTDIKDSLDSTVISEYIYEVLITLPFWSKETIKKQIDLKFNLKKIIKNKVNK
jgi:hypothetical protein